jgi:cyclopropane-fatty-acyl-phospholipid synthase
VTGELDVDGDLAEGLRRVWAPRRPDARPELGVRGYAKAFAAALRLGALGIRARSRRGARRG